MTTLKRFLALFLISTITLSAWGTDPVVDDIIFQEEWGGNNIQANAYTFTGTTTWSGSTTGLSYSSSSNQSLLSNATAGGITTDNFFFVKASESTLTMGGIAIPSNVTGINVSFASNKTIIQCTYSFDDSNYETGATSVNGTQDFDIDCTDESTLYLKFTKNGTSSNARLDDIIITVTEVSSGSSYTITAESNNDSWGTVSGTTTITASPKSGYRVVSGDGGYTVTSGTATVTNNGDNTFSVSASTDCTVRINFEAIPSHTVTWSSNGDNSNTVSYQEGADINFPTSADGCDEKTFIGWSANTVAVTDVAPSLVSEATMGTSDITYYAVFADADGDAATLTKMVAGDNFTNGDNIVIVAHGTTVALYQQTTNTSYVKKWTFDNDVETLAADNKKWITVSTATGGWYLGDATNGYLNNSNNNLYCDNDQSIWTLNDNSDGTFNLIGSSGYYLSYRSDLTESNKLWRGGGTSGTSGNSTLDIYKYTGGSASYSGYTTSCTVPTEVTVTFDANGGTGTMTPQVMDYNTATALTANTFTREGYTFQGWATSASGTKVYNDGASVTLKKNTILYAVWQVNSHNVTFTPDPTGATVTINSQSTSPQSANYGTTVTIAITPATHYTIGSVTAIGAISSANIPLNGTGYTRTFTMPDEDVNVTVTMTAETSYTVTWSMNGDESTKDIYYEGQSIVFPASADGCDGKTFMGWSADPVAEQDDAPTYTTSATMPAHAVTYYAVYAEAGEGSGTPVELINEEFDNSSTSDASSAIGTSTFANFSGATDKAYKSQYGGLKLGSSSSRGYITTKTLDLSAAFTVTMDVTKYGTDGGNIVVTIYNDEDVELDSKTILNANFGTGKSLSFDAATSTSKVEIATSSKRAYIDNVVITSGGGTSYSGYTTTCGAGISAKNIGWMTTAQGQKVKRTIPVSAKNFDDATTLSASCTNSNFTVTLGETAVPAGATGLTTTLTVEYTPTASNTREENVEIVLTAGDKTRTITVSGRSVPDEFLLITKKNSSWYALPANMTGGAGEYDGVEVSPNDNTTPTVVSVSPSTIIYTLSSVADSRYVDNGNLVRLVGNDNKCLWGNKATSATKVNIQNYAQLGATNGDNYEWDLVTTDGVHYYIESPCNAEFADGRRLAYGSKFGMYKEETVFFIVKAGCSSQPGDILVTPRRVDATFSWVSNSSTMHIDLYTNEGMNTGHLSATASSSPYVFNGLEETTDYWYRLTPGEDTDCAVTGTFKTTGPIIDIVEWEENGVVLFIDKGDINPLIVIDGQEEHGSITGGGNATELFFAKYFEGAGEMKLLSIFNGTKQEISLSGYKFYDRHAGGGATSFGEDKEYDLSSLGSISAGQEIIFFSRPNVTQTPELVDCSDDFLDEMTTKNKISDNPRWIECASDKFAGKAINFNGNDALILKKGNEIIDVIGSLGTPGQSTNCKSEDAWEGHIKNMDYQKSPSDPSFDAFFEASSLSPSTTADSTSILNAFGINLEDEYIDISTARCIFFRDKRVISGDSAVKMNTGAEFVTFTNHIEAGTDYTSEWYGRSVCMTLSTANKAAAGVTNDAKPTCNSYQDIANMDYNQYYIDWHNIDPGKELSSYTSDPETKEYTIPIDNMRQYACLNLRFQLKMGDEVLTEASQQVPIVVTGNTDTNDPLFSELVVDQSTHTPSYSHSVTRCSTCDVVVLGSATLTKGADGDAKDVPAVGNVKVYPGGKLIVPSGTNYTVNSLAFRRQEEEVSTANIQGNLSITASDATYFDLRVDPTNWHYITLPFDVKVSDIRFANPAETSVPVLGSDYLLKWYDGEKRAATQAAGSWTMVDPGATLKKGLGYIFSIPGDGKVKREFRFPMSNDVIEEEKSDKMVTGVYGYGCDKSFEKVRANHRGWNMLGNPYLLPYTCDISTPLETGLIVEDHSTDPWNGHFKFDEASRTANLRYIVEPVDNGWSEYRQVSVTDYPMKPFTCYFVQIGGTDPSAEQGIDFHLAKVNRSSIVRRSPAEYEDEEETHPVWCAVTLTSPNGEKDETTMLISNDFTDEYDMMDDLVKMRGTYYQYAQITTAPVLASRNNEGEMAFNALPDSSALAGIPLNYFAATQGQYTFAYDAKYDKDNEVKEVKLWDKATGQWYDLMNENYSFNTARTDNKDRFVLSVRVERKQKQIATGLEDIGAYKGDKPRKVLINSHVYIQRGSAIYDVTGKEVFNF